MSLAPPPSPYPAPGEIIGESWRVEKILGEGGMGAVARAWDLILHTPVAIKFMNPQFLTFPGAEERFINEGKASALIKSDHVVPVMKAGKTHGGTPYLVMECLEGVDLADLIARDGQPGLPIERSVHFVLQVLRALQAAHAIGIIHRDMKPSNCFAVTKDGEEDFVKILDFGISKVQKPGAAALTATNSALGTPLYMSPEQAKSPRDVDARSDLYSVGVILYEMLTGHTPFFSESGEFTEILFKLFTADAPPVQSTRPDLPDDLAAAVHKALARDVDHRFPSALAMAEALAPFCGERSQHLLARMRAFKGPAKNSVAPPEDLPRSMEAFSNLQRGPSTGVMPDHPADGSRGAPVTALLARAPGIGVPAPRLVQADPTRGDAVTPELVEARALPEEAGARTQYDEHPGSRPPSGPPDPRAGASTDLSTARDTSATELGRRPARSPVVFVLPAVALLAIVGAAVGLRKTPPKVEKDTASASSFTAAVPSTAVTASATNLTLAPTREAIATAVASASAAPSAYASPDAGKTVTTTPAPGRNPTHAPPPGTSVLDTAIKQ
jgi:serine/threonine-protein kinase